MSSLTGGVSVEGGHLALPFLQLSLETDVDVVHQMREERQSKSYGCAVLL